MLGGVGTLAACAVPDDSAPMTGSVLKLGLAGGGTSDTLDPRTFIDFVPANIGYQIMNGLVEIDADGNAVPELFESWEPSPDAREWVFQVRKDVFFHNGKPLLADDLIYSLNLHRGESASAARVVVQNIRDIEKLDTHQIRIVLDGGDAELPATLSDYRLLGVPDGFTDWNKPVGTGAYTLERFEPGVRCITRKAGDYWKPNAGHVDAIELLVINDDMARTNALISGQVDVVNRIDGRTADLLKRNKHLQVIRSQSGQHAILAMNCATRPCADGDVRRALKFAIDRERIVRTVLNGYGSVGNDQPIGRANPYCNTDLPQHTYDPDKARFYLKKARMDRLRVALQVSPAAFSGAEDTAVLFQGAAAECDIAIDVKREPADGYWSNVWMKAPFYASMSDGRPTLDSAFAKAYKASSSTNDTNWRRPDFDLLANEARATLDPRRRHELFGECQRMIYEDGGALIPMFIDHIEAGSTKVRGWKPSAVFDLMGMRIGEKVWLQS